jgi:hypothetical protein
MAIFLQQILQQILNFLVEHQELSLLDRVIMADRSVDDPTMYFILYLRGNPGMMVKSFLSVYPPWLILMHLQTITADGVWASQVTYLSLTLH